MGGVQVRMFILVNASQPLLNFIYCFTSNIIVQLSIHVFEPVTALSSILMVAIYTQPLLKWVAIPLTTSSYCVMLKKGLNPSSLIVLIASSLESFSGSWCPCSNRKEH
jgi:hypothetical protein